MTAPAFSPIGGVGSTYKDPKTGEMYKFTAQGWVLQSSDIQKETAQTGAFEVKPDEEGFVEWAKSKGSSQAQIEKGLTESRRVKANLGQQGQVETEKVVKEVDTTNPYFDESKGRILTKKEVLLDAFNKGVTKTSELDKVESLYDKLVGTDEEQLTNLEDFETLSPEKQEQTREKLKKIVITKGQKLATGLEREGVLGTVGTFETGQELIDKLEEVKTGLITGTVRGGLSVFGTTIIPGTRAIGKTTQEEDELNALMTVYTAQFIKAISGAQVSDKERQFLMKALPSETKTEQNNVAGIKSIEEFLSNRYSASLGVDMSPLKSQKGRKDPMKIFSDDEEVNPLGI